MMDLSGGGEYEMNLRVILCYVGSIAILLVWYVHVLWKTVGNCVLTLCDFVQQFI